jgi:surface carbohydrate biosynthesis protein
MRNLNTAIIHTDAVRREFPGNYVLAEKLKSFGFKVSLTSRITTKIIATLTSVDILILSHPFDLDELDLLKFIQKGVKIYVVDVEGHLGWEEAISTTYKKEDNLKIFSGILVWNQWSKDWIVQNIGVNNVEVTGSIRTSLYNHIEVTEKTEVIGILGRFEFINVFDERHNFKLLTKHHKQGGYWREFKLRRWKYDLDLFSACLDVIDIALKLGKKVSIRPHPNENYASYEIIRKYFDGKVLIDKSPDYLEWLSNIDVLVGSTSTAFSEAYLAKIPIICMDKMIDDSYLDGYTEWEQVNQTCAYFPNDKKELKSILSQNLLSTVSSNDFDKHLNEYYDLDNGDAINRIISIVKSNKKIVDNKSIFQPLWLSLVTNLIDFLVLTAVIFKSILDKNYYNKFKNYHYNKFLHKPSKIVIKACNK